jgi:hypothetical protein
VRALWRWGTGRWNRFWFREVDGLPLGAARVGIALAGVVLWCGTLPLVRHFYSDAGEFPIAAARSWSVEWVARFLMPDPLGAYPAVAFLFALWGVSILALLLGWRTRLAAWLNWGLVTWFLFRNPTFNNGGDEVYRFVSFYLALGYLVIPPPRRAFSLDRRRAGARGGREDGSVHVGVGMPAWPLRMIQIQIALVYLVSGFWKVVGAPWWDGSALFYALGHATFTRFGVPDWPGLHIPFAMASITIAWWEFLFPVLVTRPRTRVPTLVFGVLLHLAILLTMSIGVFPFIMVGCYPVFLGAAELRGLGRRVAAFVGRRGGGAQPSQPRISTNASAAAGVSQ